MRDRVTRRRSLRSSTVAADRSHAARRAPLGDVERAQPRRLLEPAARTRRAYVDVLRGASLGRCHAVDRGAIVMTGGLSPVLRRGCRDLAAQRSCAAIYELGGAPSFEAVAHAPVPLSNPPTRTAPSNDVPADAPTPRPDGRRRATAPSRSGAPRSVRRRAARDSVSEARRSVATRVLRRVERLGTVTGPLLSATAVGASAPSPQVEAPSPTSCRPALPKFSCTSPRVRPVGVLRSTTKLQPAPSARVAPQRRRDCQREGGRPSPYRRAPVRCVSLSNTARPRRRSTGSRRARHRDARRPRGRRSLGDTACAARTSDALGTRRGLAYAS